MRTTVISRKRRPETKESGARVAEEASSLGEWSMKLNLTVLLVICVIMKKMWPVIIIQTYF